MSHQGAISDPQEANVSHHGAISNPQEANLSHQGAISDPQEYNLSYQGAFPISEGKADAGKEPVFEFASRVVDDNGGSGHG